MPNDRSFAPEAVRPSQSQAGWRAGVAQLSFALDQARHGMLTARQILYLPLPADLGALSACETSLGAVQFGEGVFGLRRPFVLAGARTLVMSLWKVPDRQTQELMEVFYRRILRGTPHSEALGYAQLELKERYPQPLCWGAFICQGDPGSLLGTYRWERNGRRTC